MDDDLPKTASCRHCRQELRGRPYHEGAWGAWRLDNGKEAKINFYGGYVCSWQCDFNTSLALEQSMPGHGHQQRSLGTFAQQKLDRNWSNEP